MDPSWPQDEALMGANPDFRIPDLENPEKPEKLQMTYQIKALAKLVNVVTLEIRISGYRIRKIP